MSWDMTPAGDAWKDDTAGAAADTWGSGDAGAIGDSWGGGANGAAEYDGGDNACRVCHQEGHFARDCPEKPAGGLTGECYNCGEVGHNKADCTNPTVERAFTGTCNACGETGHQSRSCPTNPDKCRLCDKPGHRALDCKEQRVVNWAGVPELSADEAWTALVDAAKAHDVDDFRDALRAYARAIHDQFDLVAVETALRDDKHGVYLIAKKVELMPNETIVDLVGNPDREYVLSVHLSDKPRRAKMAEGWPSSKEENLERLKSAGTVEDRGVPLCNGCGELGHVKKHCKQMPEEDAVSVQPAITCVYCQSSGHRARDCPEERVSRTACKNCKQEGHQARDCPEPRSAEGVECRRCNEMGHFSKDCPNATARTCRNCNSADHMAKECPEPPNPANVTCRNCDQTGHFAKDCTEKKDWSRVTCNVCGEKGHTFKRCPQANGDGGASGANAGASGWAIEEDVAPVSGGWQDDTVGAAAGSGGW